MIKVYKLLSLVIVISSIIGACGMRNTPTREVLPATHAPQITQLIPTVTDEQTGLGELSAGVDGLEFYAFVETSYRRLLSRDPETVLELGLSQVYGTPTDQLTDISDEYIHQTQTLESDVLSQLQQYDCSALTHEQQLTYDIYSWYLDDKVKGHKFMYDDYPINPTVFSVHLDLLQFFTDLRPVTNLQEAQDYIASLIH